MNKLNATEIYAIYDNIRINLWFGVSISSTILGAVANLYTIIVFALYKEFGKAHYRLILFVTITDVLCDAIFVPIEVFQSFVLVKYKRLVGDDNFCIWSGGFFAILYSGSVIGQLVVALNRFIAVYMPNFYRTRMTVRLAFIAWFVAAILFPTFYFYAGFNTWIILSIHPIFGDCIENDTPQWKLVRITLTIYVPLASSLFIYFLIMMKIMITTPANRKEVLKRARGSAAMLANMIFYGLCVVPLWITINSASYDDILETTLWIKLIFRLSLAINPLFYFALDLRIRTGYIKLYRRIFRINQVDSNDRNATSHTT